MATLNKYRVREYLERVENPKIKKKKRNSVQNLLHKWFIASFFIMALGFVLPIISASQVNESHGQAWEGSASGPDYTGFSYVPNENIYLNSITRHNGVTATNAYIQYMNLTNISTALFVGNIAVFSPPVKLFGRTNYTFLVGNEPNSAYVQFYTGIGAFNITGNYEISQQDMMMVIMEE
jgi:hypothetical protein